MTKRQVEISPSQRLIREYWRSRQEMSAQGVEHELALRHSFQDLLGDSRLHGWTLIAELGAKTGRHTVRPDATPTAFRAAAFRQKQETMSALNRDASEDGRRPIMEIRRALLRISRLNDQPGRLGQTDSFRIRRHWRTLLRQCEDYSSTT